MGEAAGGPGTAESAEEFMENTPDNLHAAASVVEEKPEAGDICRDTARSSCDAVDGAGCVQSVLWNN